MTNIETKHNFEKKNWIMFSGKMFFIFTNCNVSCLDNILLGQNFFLCQFCTIQKYMLVHVLKQFMSKGSMNMVKIRDYRRRMRFFLSKHEFDKKKIAWQMFVQCTIILSVISPISKFFKTFSDKKSYMSYRLFTVYSFLLYIYILLNENVTKFYISSLLRAKISFWR